MICSVFRVLRKPRMTRPPRKRRRKNRPSPAAHEWTLSADLLLEIVARSDPAILIRCAAACKLLRRDILDPSFIRRVTRHGGAVPPCVLAYLHPCSIRGRNHNRNLRLVSLVHPATRAASSFTDGNLAPCMSRHALDILRRYQPLTSRGGLVVFRRRSIENTSIYLRNSVQNSRLSERGPDLCVLDPMTGDCTYLSGPPGFHPKSYRTYVLLTAADGIGYSFTLLVAQVNFYNGGVRIAAQAAKSSEAAGGASWGPVTSDAHLHLPSECLQDKREPVVLHGGIVHWLLLNGVLTYDIGTERLGTVELPPTSCQGKQRLLGKSPDGRLRLLVAERFVVSVWLQLSDSWTKEAVIDLEQKLRSLNPNTFTSRVLMEFQRSRERSGAVLLQVYRIDKRNRPGQLIVLDLETKEVRRQESRTSLDPGSLLFEVDLSLRLQAMKIFP